MTLCDEHGSGWGVRGGFTAELLVSDAVAVPFAIGLFRSAIVLPAAYATWTDDKLEMVLAHELAHIQRHDVLWHWISKLACCIAWFHPLVWLVARQAMFERERACDDRVLDSGLSPVEYGRSLVEIAAAMAGRTSILAGSVSMAEPPLKRRLYCILVKSCDRRKASTRTRCFTAFLFIALACAMGTVRPLATATPASPQDAQSPPGQDDESDVAGPQNQLPDTVKLPASLRGSITDIDAQPISGARVEIKLVSFGMSERRRDRREFTVHRWTATTDDQGVYSIDPSALGEVPAHYHFGVSRVWADGFAVGFGRYWPTAEEVAGGMEIQAARLRKGRRIFGTLRNALGNPTPAVVKGAGEGDDPGDAWFLEGEQVSESGEFELFVPESGDVELMFYASGHAPKRVALDGDREDIGTIVLSSGARVTGQLLDRKGLGVAGAAIAMDLADEGGLEGIGFNASFAVLSDPTGHFELPPATGKCRIWAAASATRTDMIGNETVVGVQPPLVAPVVLVLPEDGGTKDLVLREAETQIVSGTVRWESGDPVADFEIAGGAMIEGSGIKLACCETDAEGHYQIELPRPLADVFLTAFGARDDQGIWHMAYGKMEAPGRGSGQFISFDQLDGDASGADWELRLFRESAPISAAQQREEQEFAKLAEQEQEAAAVYWAAEKKAVTPEEQTRVYMELDPRNAMAGPYLAFEREHRGSKTALRAIQKVLQGANSVGDPQTKVAKARNEAVDRLIEHYLGHEDLSRTFRSLDGGPETPRADTLLRLAAERSPHAQVRAAALLARADRIKTKLRYAQMLPELERFVAELLRDNPAPSERAEMTRKLDELRSLDGKLLQSQANAWLDTIAREHAEIIKPQDPSGVTYGTAAADLKFAINNVVVGQLAPELSAKDVAGKPFRFSDFRGQIVVLTFWQSIFDSADELPNQDVAREFSGQPVKFVTVMDSPDEAKFTAAVQSKEHVGSIIWEPLNGPHASKWGLDHYPTTFLIDQQGTLTSATPVPDWLSKQLRRLLK